nr:hypothetical protein Itr_chr12CG31700 [Ipomoea trifida]
MDLSMYCFRPAAALGTRQACSSANSPSSSAPRRTRTWTEVFFSLKESWRSFCRPALPFLNGALTIMFPILSSSTISPVCNASPVHSSALELPFRHCMERTAAEEPRLEAEKEELFELLDDENERSMGIFRIVCFLRLFGRRKQAGRPAS